MLDMNQASGPDFLAGGGEMGALMRAYDWSSTPLGSAETWPQSLKTTIRVALATNHPMLIFWGPELIQFYNDAYRATVGAERHPSALGQCARECWEDIWPIIGPRIEQVMIDGGPTWHENLLVPVIRNGKLEQVCWSYGYSSIKTDGVVAGLLAICRDVSGVSRDLRERQIELARVQQFGGIGGLEVDLRDGYRSRRSPEYLAIHGLPPEAADETSEDWVKRLHPDDRIATERQFREAVRGDVRDYSSTYRIIRPSDGQVRWICARGIIERDAAGVALRLVGAHSDITEQVMAERALRESEEEFRTLANAVPHHVWTAKPDGMATWFNPRVYEYTGTDIGDLDGKKWAKIIHPDDLPVALAAWTRALEIGETYEVELRLCRKDGAYRWFLGRAVPARDELGRIIRWIGTSTDVHDQKTIAAELAALNATLAERVQEKTRERDRIWNVSQDLLLVADLDGTLRSVNPAWTKTLGWTEQELLNRKSDWLEHPDDHEKAVAELDSLNRGNPTIRFEGRVLHKDGSYRWLSWTAVPDAGQIYAVARDVTEERAAAERLKATEEALRQSQKMEAVGQLTGGIAHDFNNLLTGIIGSLDLMKAKLSKGKVDSIERYIGAAMTSANRAAALTHRLLAFARRQPLSPKSVNANQLIESLEDLLRRTIGEDIDLEIIASDKLWNTLCDPNQLESGLLNLAINARDAMPEGGQLTIKTHNVRLDGVLASNPALSPGDYICIDVIDTGTGMTDDIVERAFDPFFTTKPIGQGTGLGLSMIYGFTRQSNGHVAIDSNPGHGTSVKIYLPRHVGDALTDAGSSSDAGVHLASGETVLLVEDEPVVRSVVVELLEEQGYQTLEAVDGPSGLHILTHHERIDLLVTDIGLPGMNGRELGDQARKLKPGMKILFITGYADNVATARGFLQPGMDMMTKPFEGEKFLQRVKDMIAG